MALVEPVPGEPAATASLGDERALVVAEYHAGLEPDLRREGVEVPSQAAERRGRLFALIDRTGADRVVFLGDLATAIGDPPAAEREELVTLLSSLGERVAVTVVRGNHDTEFEAFLAAEGLDAAVAPATGTRLGPVGFVHGHTWPAPSVVDADAVCVAHEHPRVRLTDEVGGGRDERAWLRGRVDPEPFATHHDDAELSGGGDLVVFPAFNDLSGGTWVNQDREFLSPYLPAALVDGQVYLVDGTRLGPYEAV